MHKEGHRRKTFKKRYFVVWPRDFSDCGMDAPVLFYFEDDQPEPLMAAHPRGSTSRFGPPPLRYQQPGCHQSRLPPAALHPSTIPARRAVAPANAVTPANDARAWNDLRDALGTSVPDLIVAQLLEEHSGDVGAAAQAYYATPRGAMSVGRNANGNLCRP